MTVPGSDDFANFNFEEPEWSFLLAVIGICKQPADSRRSGTVEISSNVQTFHLNANATAISAPRMLPPISVKEAILAPGISIRSRARTQNIHYAMTQHKLRRGNPAQLGLAQALRFLRTSVSRIGQSPRRYILKVWDVSTS